MMNRETSFRTSDTLVVRDRSRQRRWVIIGAVVVLLAAVAVLLMMMSGSSKKAADAAAAAAGAGQVPTVTVVVPGRSSVPGITPASGPLAPKRAQPVGIAG